MKGSRFYDYRKFCLTFILTILCSIALFSQPVLSADKILDVNELNQTPIELPRYLSVLEDETKTLTFAQIQAPENAERFKTYARKTLNFGYSASAYWLKLALENNSDKTVERVLELEQPLLEYVDFYYPDENQHYQVINTGYAKPFSSRAIESRAFVFPILIPAHTHHVIFLRIASPNAMLIPISLWEINDFRTHERNNYVIESMCYGFMLAMIIVNLLFFLIIKDSSYLLFTLVIIFGIVSHLGGSGIGGEFIYSNSPFLIKTSSNIGSSLAIATALLFLRQILNTAIVIPKLDKWIQGFIYLFFICACSSVVFFEQTAKWVLAFHLFYLFFFSQLIPIACILKGQRDGYFFLGTFVVINIFFILKILAIFDVIALSPLVKHGTLIGQEVEVFVFSYVLAHRYKTIRLEKELAQQQLIENLKTSEHILEMRVLERTAELEMANLQLKALSTTDGLTGISNRRHFDEMLDFEWERAQRQNQMLSLGLLDVDWFKKYNDFYGHQMGDECLKQVAKVLTENIARTGDLVARYGGEEFVFVLPATDGDAALQIAQKICRAFEKLGLPHELSDFDFVSVSIGIATLVPNDTLNPKMLLKNADVALYLAKEQGRNRVVTYLD